MHIHMNTTIGELLENPRTKGVIEGMTDSLIQHMGGSSEEEDSAASEAITKEMSLKMMENSPLRSMRSFMGMTTEEIQEFIQKLQEAADRRRQNHGNGENGVSDILRALWNAQAEIRRRQAQDENEDDSGARRLERDPQRAEINIRQEIRRPALYNSSRPPEVRA